MTLDDLQIRDLTLTEAVTCVGELVNRGEGGWVTVVNANKLALIEEHVDLADHVREADLVLADGISIPLAQVLRGEHPVQRVCGIDLGEALIEEAAKRRWQVGLIGGRPEVIGPALEALRRRAPGLQVCAMHHGFTEGHQPFLDAVRASPPDIVLVGLGSPAQEQFISTHRDALGASVCLGVGGAFDVWSGRRTRAPAVLRSVGLEWAWRVASQPALRGPRLVRSASALLSWVRS